MLSSFPVLNRDFRRSGDLFRQMNSVIRKGSFLLAGGIAKEDLPPRVRSRLEAQQRQSELIVGGLQVAAILTFAVLYALTPKAFPPSVPFEPVPWTLGLYAAFTGYRLWRAWRGELSPVFLMVSAAVDVAVLMLTIWSFHLQYQSPAALYLKAPTLMYVFILIALRSLRFEARYVLVTGAAAAVGWLFLLAYALWADPGEAMITRDYRVYMTSYSVLLGAELDKVISIGIVTSILAVALQRARRLLVSGIADGVALGDLSRFFSPEVAERIRGSRCGVFSGIGERRHAAVLTVDLRGFTKLSRELEPDQLIGLLGEYQSLVVPIVQNHGGSIDKYLGDGILASFGATKPSSTAAADACRAVDDLLAGVEAWRADRLARNLPAPSVGAAMVAGEVVFGVVGHDSRLEYTVIGDVVNLAAKLEKHNKEEGAMALTTFETFTLAQGQGYIAGEGQELRRARRVDGVAEPLDLMVLAAA